MEVSLTYTVYALFDEREPTVIRYVGFSRYAEKRVNGHLDEARRSSGGSHRLNWIRKVIREGSSVGWRVLETFDIAEAAAIAEIKYIKEFLATGHPLVNGTEGGDGVQGYGGQLAPEALARRNETMNSPEYLIKRSRLSIEYWSDEEKRKQQSEAMLEHFATPEGDAQREVIVETNKLVQTGLKRSDEAKEKMRQAKLGKPHARQRTPEWNLKIALAQIGKKRRPWTEEERARHKAGQNHEKMSVSAKARNAKTG